MNRNYLLREIAFRHHLVTGLRARKISDKKNYFRWFCVKKLMLTTTETAKFANCHHSTVVYSARVVEYLLKDQTFLDNIKVIAYELDKLLSNEPVTETTDIMKEIYSDLTSADPLDFREFKDKYEYFFNK